MSNAIIAFANEVISQKNKSITGEIFLLIQNNKDLMQEYLRLVEGNGLSSVNTQIGRRVKEAYGLTNAAERNDEPSSTLIKSYQEFV